MGWSINLLKLITISLLVINSLSAEVRFDFQFTDPDGEGFNAPQNEWMIQAATEGANLLGKCIQQNAFVTVEVRSLNEGYANAQILLKKIESVEGKYTTAAMDKILHENTEFSGIWEWRVQFNTENFFEHNILKRAIIHELTHTLGLVAIGTPQRFHL